MGGNRAGRNKGRKRKSEQLFEECPVHTWWSGLVCLPAAGIGLPAWGWALHPHSRTGVLQQRVCGGILCRRSRLLPALKQSTSRRICTVPSNVEPDCRTELGLLTLNWASNSPVLNKIEQCWDPRGRDLQSMKPLGRQWFVPPPSPLLQSTN